MISKNNEIEIAQKYFELANNRDLKTIPNVLDTKIIYTSDTTGIYFGINDTMEMMSTFFDKFKYLNWKIESIELIKDSVIEIYFTLTMIGEDDVQIEKKGVERLVVDLGLIKYIEVRNL